MYSVFPLIVDSFQNFVGNKTKTLVDIFRQILNENTLYLDVNLSTKYVSAKYFSTKYSAGSTMLSRTHSQISTIYGPM